MLTQFVTLQVDKQCVELAMAPNWFSKFRGTTFAVYLLATSLLFAIFYTQKDSLQRRNDMNRIGHLKSAMELEDSDFVKMVDDFKIDYDEYDLKQIEKQVMSSMDRKGAGPLGI